MESALRSEIAPAFKEATELGGVLLASEPVLSLAADASLKVSEFLDQHETAATAVWALNFAVAPVQTLISEAVTQFEPTRRLIEDVSTAALRAGTDFVQGQTQVVDPNRAAKILFGGITVGTLVAGGVSAFRHFARRGGPALRELRDSPSYRAFRDARGSTTFNKLDDFVSQANDPAPNWVYSYNGISIRTDRVGRTAFMEGDYRNNPVGRNDNKLQAATGRDGYETDVGFHLWPDSAGAPTTRLTVVPGNGRRTGDGLPNLNQGAYGSFEKELMELSNSGNSVRLRVETVYSPSNMGTRPDVINAQFQLNGGEWSAVRQFVNKY